MSNHQDDMEEEHDDFLDRFMGSLWMLVFMPVTGMIITLTFLTLIILWLCGVLK